MGVPILGWRLVMRDVPSEAVPGLRRIGLMWYGKGQCWVKTLHSATERAKTFRELKALQDEVPALELAQVAMRRIGATWEPTPPPDPDKPPPDRQNYGLRDMAKAYTAPVRFRSKKRRA